MNQVSNLFVRRVGIFIIALSVFFTGKAAPILQGPIWQDGSLELTISGSNGEAVVLQASRDLKGWNDVQTYYLNGGPALYQQAAGANQWNFFRLRSGTVETGTQLPSLADSPNAVFVAGEGFDTVQFAPNGTLGFIFWKGRDLMMRERTTSGNWSEQVVSGNGNLFQVNSTRTDWTFQPAALLLYDSNSQPHIFRVNGGKSIAHLARSGANWAQVELIQNHAANADLGMLVGALGAGDKFHLATISTGSSANLTYGSNKNGSWSWATVSSIGGYPWNYFPPSHAPRWLSLAVDANNAAHLVFRPQFQVTFPTGYARAYNELAYASNKSGQWNVQIVQKPLDDSGEAGNGMSIAIGPDNKPYLASWYNERGDGGSAQHSRLFYQTQDSSGNWTRAQVISRPDGYIAGDGEKGTGFSPYLRFDGRGRPHILFLDQASEHFPVTGQSEYAGNIRHAYFENGQWQVETVFRQTDPMRNQMVYPAFAMNGSELAVTGLQRFTEWNMNQWPPTVVSSYKLTFLTAPLR
jgi:hypothetical protein